MIIDYLFLDYLGLLQEKLSKHDNNFENTNFKNLSGLGISDILINIMSCHGFSKSSISIVVLTCCNDLVPYDISKGLVIFEIEVRGVDNIPINAKKNKC